MAVEQVYLDQIEDNRYQTRENYSYDYIEELAADIRKNGLLQTPVGRRLGDRVELAFGHCRLRAFKANLQRENNGREVPARGKMPIDIQQLTDEQMAEFVWSENEQRQDCNPIERALSLQRAMQELGYTNRELSERRGISPSTISNLVSLLQLPQETQMAIRRRTLTERHGRELMPLVRMAQQREVERLTRQALVDQWTVNDLIVEVNRSIQRLTAEIYPEIANFKEWPEGLPRDPCIKNCYSCASSMKRSGTHRCTNPTAMNRRTEDWLELTKPTERKPEPRPIEPKVSIVQIPQESRLREQPKKQESIGLDWKPQKLTPYEKKRNEAINTINHIEGMAKSIRGMLDENDPLQAIADQILSAVEGVER